MNKILIISILISSLNAHSMLKTVATKALIGSMAAGTVASYPKVKQSVEKWKTAQQHKKDVEKQNMTKETSDR